MLALEAQLLERRRAPTRRLRGRRAWPRGPARRVPPSATRPSTAAPFSWSSPRPHSTSQRPREASCGSMRSSVSAARSGAGPSGSYTSPSSRLEQELDDARTARGQRDLRLVHQRIGLGGQRQVEERQQGLARGGVAELGQVLGDRLAGVVLVLARARLAVRVRQLAGEADERFIVVAVAAHDRMVRAAGPAGNIDRRRLLLVLEELHVLAVALGRQILLRHEPQGGRVHAVALPGRLGAVGEDVAEVRVARRRCGPRCAC